MKYAKYIIILFTPLEIWLKNMDARHLYFSLAKIVHVKNRWHFRICNVVLITTFLTGFIGVGLIFSFNFAIAQDIQTDTAEGEIESIDTGALETIEENVEAEQELELPVEEQVEGVPIEEVIEEEVEVVAEVDEQELEEVIEDENITFEDLEVNDPTLLPTSPYYPIKNIWRGYRATITFSPLKKAKLKMRFADERLIEAKKVSLSTDKPEIVTNALERYEKEFSAVSDLLQKVPEEKREEVKEFADKIIDHSFKQQRLIDGIEKRIDPLYFEKINKVRENGIAHFAQALTNVTPPEEIQEKIANVIEQQRGSDFKHFKNLEVLKAVEEKVPEVAKEAIRHAQDNALKRLQEKMTEIGEEKRERFKEYVDDIGGNEARHLEIIRDFTTREVPDIIREEMEKAGERARERIEHKMKKFTREEQKKEFLKHLEGGKMEDLRIIKELENNLSPETIDNILEVKNKAFDNFRREFETATTPQEQDKFFDKLEQFHDVKQFEVFKEIEKIIPKDKKEFFEKMKEKATEEIKENFDRARDERERVKIFKRLAGDNLGDFEIIKDFALPPEIEEGILRQQVERFRDRIDIIQDPEKLHLFQERISDEGFIREELEKRAPDIFAHILEKTEKVRAEVKKDEAIDKLNKAKDILEEIKNKVQKLESEKPEVIERFSAPISHHLENARKHINEAEQALGAEQYGHVFGAATAALENLKNISRLISDAELHTEISEGRIERLEEELELREELIEEFEEFDEDLFEQEFEREEKIKEILEEKLKILEKTKRKQGEEFNEREKELFRKEQTKTIKQIFKERLEPEETEVEFELRFEEQLFPEDTRAQFKQTIEQLPAHIQSQLQNLPVDLLPQALERLKIKVESGGEAGGPEVRPEAKPFPEPLPPTQVDRPETERKRPDKAKEKVICIQVITPAWNPKTGECKEFSTPCDVPDHWEKIDNCKNIRQIKDTRDENLQKDRERLEREKLDRERLQEKEDLSGRRGHIVEPEKIEKPELPVLIRPETDFREKEQERLKQLEDERKKDDALREEQRRKELERQLREPLGEPIQAPHDTVFPAEPVAPKEIMPFLQEKFEPQQPTYPTNVKPIPSPDNAAGFTPGSTGGLIEKFKSLFNR